MNDPVAPSPEEAQSPSPKAWVAPLETVVFTDILDTAGNTGVGSDGGSGGFNRS